MAYDFSTLNDKELEELSRDLLNRKFDLDFQNFKVGKDRGVDLRFSSSMNQNAHVVQVKHYLKSGFNKLFDHLKKEEFPKVKTLSPDRYYIVTSVQLNAQQKDKIYGLFQPYIKSSNDIFGQQDLNKYLLDYPDIEKKWFKLWLTSTNVLLTILNNGILGRSAFAESSVKKNIQLYVKSKSYDDARSILTKFNYILITGQPGVGKTTLAKLLTFELLAEEFQLIYIDDDIKEAELLFDPNPLKKQVFYFDDFLGSNYLEIVNPKTSESGMVNFLERIKTATHKYLILTTRTIILKNALSKYEKLNRARIDIARKEIVLGNYNEFEKAQILYNHLFYSELSDDFREEIFKDKNYWKIITHKNYYPRLIEFFTTPINISGITAENYFDFVMKNLENPEEVWKYAYENQLSVEEKILLHAIFSQPYSVTIQITQLIFEKILDTEVDKYSYRPQQNPFNNSCKRLLDGIIKKEKELFHEKQETLNFINPSINDFLINYFANNKEEKWKLIDSFLYIEQYEKICANIFENLKLKKLSDQTELIKLVNKILAIQTSIRSLTFLNKNKNYELYKNLRVYALLSKLNTPEILTNKIDSSAHIILESMTIQDLTRESKIYFIKLIERCKIEGLVFSWVKENWNEIIKKIISMARDEDDFDEVVTIFDDFGEDYEDFILAHDNYELFHEIVEEYVNDETTDWIRDEQSTIYNEDDWEDLKSRISEMRSDFFHKYNLDDDNYLEQDYFNDYLFERLIKENEEVRANLDYDRDRDDWRASNRIENKPMIDSKNAIDDLFSK